jgi:hypothetical protein
MLISCGAKGYISAAQNIWHFFGGCDAGHTGIGALICFAIR